MSVLHLVLLLSVAALKVVVKAAGPRGGRADYIFYYMFLCVTAVTRKNLNHHLLNQCPSDDVDVIIRHEALRGGGAAAASAPHRRHQDKAEGGCKLDPGLKAPLVSICQT